MKSIIIIIPAKNPSDKIIEICKKISPKCGKIIIINDGSNKNLNIFKNLRLIKNSTIIKNKICRGKGYSIKKAVKFIIKQKIKCNGIITVDSDGQHCYQDIKKLIKKFQKKPNYILLGIRSFKFLNTPFWNFMGNKISAKIFKFFQKLDVPDTQCGLRAIPKKYFREMLEIPFDGFDFETAYLIKFLTKYSFKTISIKTIYENEKSNFLKFYDSSKIINLLLFYK